MKKLIYLMFLFLFYSSGFSSEVLNLRLVGDHAEVSFPSSRNKQYAVEVSDDLETWDPVQEEIFGTGSEIVITHELGGRARGFYRTQRSDEFVVSPNPSFVELGSEWNYSVKEEFMGETESYTLKERVDRHSTKNGYAVAEIGTYTNGTQWGETAYILRDITNGIFVVGMEDSDGEELFNPPEPSLLNGFIPGTVEVETLPSPGPGFGPATGTRVVSIDYGTVTVFAGSFQNTVRVEMQMAGIYDFGGGDFGPYTLTEITWFDRTVGEIKSTSSMTMSGEEFSQIVELTIYILN